MQDSLFNWLIADDNLAPMLLREILLAKLLYDCKCGWSSIKGKLSIVRLDRFWWNFDADSLISDSALCLYIIFESLTGAYFSLRDGNPRAPRGYGNST